MRKLLPLILLSFFTSLNAQTLHPTCDGSRYLEEVFDEVDVTTDVLFGVNTTIGGNEKELLMDVYYPVGDEAEARPVVLVAFGGSFIGGDKEQLGWMCRDYARRGFVAVTIEYRLYDLPLFPLPETEDMQNVVTKSVGDMKAAIRYLRQDAATDNLFKIDPNWIFVGGVSAGAICALHTASMDETDPYDEVLDSLLILNGGIEGNSSDNFEYSSEVQGVINFSGALADASFLDAGDPPIVSVHDDMDGTVPYNEGFASVFGIDIAYMEGSGIIHPTADDLGIKNELWTIENSPAHISYLGTSGETLEGIMDYTAAFLFDILCEGFVINTDNLVESIEGVQLYPNPTSGIISLENLNNKSLSYTLSNSVGANINLNHSASTMDLSSLANGLYYLTIQDTESGLFSVEKIILSK